MNHLQLSILKTLVYYDALDWPLSTFEIYKYLSKVNYQLPITNYQTIELRNILEALESEELEEYISQKWGFYFLKDRAADDLAAKRIEAEKLADMKWRILRRRARWIGVAPFIRGVLVSGSMAIGNVSAESDFDLLLIAEPGRIWTARFFLTYFLGMLGWRRKGMKTKDKLCLNHYITARSLFLNVPSLYNAHTYAHAVPLAGEASLFASFAAQNQWIRDYLYRWDGFPLEQRAVRFPRLIAACGKFFEMALSGPPGNALEKMLGWLQRKKIELNPRTRERGGRIIVSDQVLEFHPLSKEKVIIERFNNRMRRLGFPELANERDSGLL